jgi:hypothetical protein
MNLVWPGIGETTIVRIDSEIVAALRPAMATIPNAMLRCASSLSFRTARGGRDTVDHSLCGS